MTSQNSGRRWPWVHWDTDRETDIDRCASMFTMTGNQNFNASQHFLVNATTSRGTEWYFEKRGCWKNFCPVSISERFLWVSASRSLAFGWFMRLKVSNFLPTGLGVSDLLFLCPFGLRKSNFFRVNRYIGYPTNRLRKSETRQPAVYWWASASFHWRKRSFY